MPCTTTQDAENGKVTTEDGEVLQADLVVAADGVHSAAVKHVLGDGVIEAGDTGWACMRWLVPRDEFLADPETAHMIQDSSTRYFTAAGGAAGLVWYPCRKYVHRLFLVFRPCPFTMKGNKLSGKPANPRYWGFSATRCRTSSTSRASSTPPTWEKVWWTRTNTSQYGISYLADRRVRSQLIPNVYVDFRAMVEPSMPLEYARKHFAPAVQTAIK